MGEGRAMSSAGDGSGRADEIGGMGYFEDVMDLARIPLDSVVLTADKKDRILNLLQNIQREYQDQAQKLEWQTQLLDAKQRLIDKYESKDTQRINSQHDHNGNALTLDIDKSYASTDGIQHNGSPTLTNTTDLSSINCIGSCDSATTPVRHRSSSWMHLVHDIQHELDRFARDDALRRHTEQLCVVVAALATQVPMLRRSIRSLQGHAESNALIVQELRREQHHNAIRLQHKHQFQRALQEDMVRLRGQCTNLHAAYTRERQCAEELQAEYADLQDDYVALEQENHHLRDVVAHAEQKYTTVVRKYRKLASINSQSNERLSMLHEDTAIHQGKLQDTIRDLQSQIDSMETDPVWLQFLQDRHLYLDLQGESDARIESLQCELSSVSSAHKRCQSELAAHQSTIDELKRVLVAQEDKLDAHQGTIDELKRVLIVQEGKWRDQSKSLLQLVDSQDHELVLLHQSAAATQESHSAALSEMQHNLDDMKGQIESLQASNAALAAMLKDHVAELKSTKKELHRRFLECESVKVAAAAVDDECMRLRQQLEWSDATREECERWQMTCAEFEQREASMTLQTQQLRDQVAVLQEHSLPDLSLLWSRPSSPPLPLDSVVLQKVKDVLDQRIQEFQRDQVQYASNAALQHYLSVESVFLSALRGRMLLLAA